MYTIGWLDRPDHICASLTAMLSAMQTETIFAPIPATASKELLVR